MRFFLPFIIFLSLIVFLWQGLALSPDEIPSALIDKKTPTFNLPNLTDPKQMLTEALFKDQITLLNIWASWCPACREEHPFLVKMKEELAKEGVVIVGLNVHDEKDSALAWLQLHGNPYHSVIFDQDGRLAMDYGSYGVPETFILDKQGIIRFRHKGEIDKYVWVDEILPTITKINEDSKSNADINSNAISSFPGK